MWGGSLRECSLEVVWQDHRAGEKALHREITKLLAGKFRLGIRQIPQKFQAELLENLQCAINGAAWGTTNPDLKQFWERMLEEIPDTLPMDEDLGAQRTDTATLNRICHPEGVGYFPETPTDGHAVGDYAAGYPQAQGLPMGDTENPAICNSVIFMQPAHQHFACERGVPRDLAESCRQYACAGAARGRASGPDSK